MRLFGLFFVFSLVSFFFMPVIRAQKDFLRAADFGDFFASAFFTGGFRPGLPGFALLYEARPFAFRPPFGFLPSDRCHAGDFAIYLPDIFFA